MADHADYSRRRQDQAQSTRDAILRSAAGLARQGGFAKMTIRDICAAAGVTTGAFYHHFASKDDLLNQGFASLDAFLEGVLAQSPDATPTQRLELLLRLYTRYMEDLGWETVALYYGRRLADPSANSMSPDRFTLRAMLECLTALSRTGVMSPSLSPQWVAEFLFRHFRGIVIDWVLHRGSYSLEDKLAQDHQFFYKSFHA